MIIYMINTFTVDDLLKAFAFSKNKNQTKY